MGGYGQNATSGHALSLSLSLSSPPTSIHCALLGRKHDCRSPQYCKLAGRAT
jgi:hypothetical protein